LFKVLNLLASIFASGYTLIPLLLCVFLASGLVPSKGGFLALDEPVGRLPTLFTNPGTQSTSPKLKRGRKSRNECMRTVRLRLLPSGAQERRLRKLADVTARLWNELNYARLVQFRALGRVDFKGTGREFYRTDEKPRPSGRGRFKYWKKRLFLVSSPGQFLGNGERRPTPQYRERTSKKLKQ